MKLFIASAALACFACVVGCNSSALKSGSASLTAQGAQAPQDEYKLSTDSKKDKAKSLPVTFSHVNHATKNYSIDGTKTIGCVECHHTDQPAAEAAKHPPLKSAHPADRAVTLTAETAKDAKTPKVETCRSCHAQDGDAQAARGHPRSDLRRRHRPDHPHQRGGVPPQLQLVPRRRGREAQAHDRADHQRVRQVPHWQVRVA